MESRGSPADLSAEVDRALASEELAHSRIARDTLIALHEFTRAGRTANQYDLAERLHGDVNEVERTRAAVKTLRQRLRSHYDGEGSASEWRLEVPKGEYHLVLVARPELAARAVAPAGTSELPEAAPDAAGAVPDVVLPSSIPAPAVLLPFPPPARGMALGRFLVAAALIIGAGGLLGQTLPARDPASVSYVGASAVVKDAQGDVIFGYDLGEPVMQESHQRRWLIEDLEGDGRADIVLAPAPLRRHPADRIVVLDSRGGLRWERSVADVGATCEPEAPLFNTIRLGTFRATPDARPLLVVTAGHDSLGTCAVAIYDSDGNLVASYCHPGHLYGVASWDADEDGDDEIVLGGSNDDLAEGALAILEDEDFGSASRRLDADPLLAPPCRWYVRLPFPRELRDSIRAYAGDISVVDGALEVRTGAEAAQFIHRFTRVDAAATRAHEDMDEWMEDRKTLRGDVTTLQALLADAHAGLRVCERGGEWQPVGEP